MINNWPKITIAIPTFNESDVVDSCLKSIFKQKYSGELEVFIIDDNSTDDTVAKAKKYPVTILINGRRDLLYGKKIGLDNATGEFFMYLDADIQLLGSFWFNKMVEPLLADESVIASFTKYSSFSSDSPLNKYITLDYLQRDPLFIWLTPSLEQVVVEKIKTWKICNYTINRMLPTGLCMYRKKSLVEIIGQRHKFVELDVIVLLVKHGHSRFAYVPNAKMHHPFITSLSELAFKRSRNLHTMYFNQPDAREWTWIDWSDPFQLLKLFIWVIYANSFVLPTIVGLMKSIYYKTWVGLYEPVFVWLTTNLILITFLTTQEGRKMLSKSFVWNQK